MDVKVKKLTKEETILDVETRSGVKTLVISETKHGHSYKDFSDWDMSDDNYFDLEELVDKLMAQMRGEKSSLKVTYSV